MADNASFTVTLVPRSGAAGSSAGVSLSLEQVDLNGEEAFDGCSAGCDAVLARSAGTNTGGSGLAAINTYINCMEDCAEENCGTTQNIEIIVRKNPNSLNYNLKASIGTLGQKRVEQDNFAESYDVNLASYVQLSGEMSQVSASWDGDVWDQYGNLRSHPNISYNSTTRQLTWGGALVVGTIRVTSLETYDIWTLDIPPRTDSTTESAWSCTVRAFYMDGSIPKIQTLNVREPDQSGTCGFGYSVEVDQDDDDDQCWEIVHWIDPCSGVEDTSKQERNRVPCS